MIEVMFEVTDGIPENAESLIRKAAQSVLTHEKINASLSITVVDASEIQRINREFRNIDKVTDVLSFPAHDNSDNDAWDGYLGDIAICFERACEQALEYNHSLERELAFLTVHGMLHISGYDHIKKEDEQIMFPLQEKILTEMGITR